MADGLHDTGNDFRIRGTFDGLLFQMRQELCDFPFDLSSGSGLALLIVGLKQARQLDHPSALPFQLGIRFGIVVTDGGDVQQG
jgi:hypothetical protein